jgi:3',5'-cyclic AMP phosphodiesterase CpdA
MLYSSGELEKQAVGVDQVLAENPNRWTVAAFHHPFYSAGRNRDERSTRDAFQEVFERRGIDLVLQGHDHAYSRSKKLLGGKVVGDDERGIVYVVSSCGPKHYVLQPLYRDVMATMRENLQLYQLITVNGNTLQYTAVTIGGNVVDTFELRK